ncbi:amino acid transporter AVT1C [Tanacetum coccineum]
MIILNFSIFISIGIHVFCGPQLYTAPYGTKEGGWFGLSLLFLYFIFTLVSSCNIGLLLDENRSIKTYPQIGKGTYGVMGIRFVMVLVCLLSFASSEESAMITKDVLEIFYSGEFTLLGYTTNQYKVILLVLCGFMLIMVLFVPDIERHDRWLTGHPYLPELFHSLINKPDYRKILYFIFVPALFQYLLAACLGYGKFGSNVESIYILNMPKDLTVSWIAAHVTVAHMMIRYVLGIYGVLKTVEDEFKRINKPFVNRFWTSVVNCALVLITIPLTILINCYGPVMALIGSTLGIAVVGFLILFWVFLTCAPGAHALVIPYIFVTNIRISQMQRFQILSSIIIVILAVAAAIAGTVDSINEMKNGGC